MRLELESVIIDVIREYCPRKAISLQESLIDDLGILDDDVADIIVEVTQLFGIHINAPDWENVSTVDDIVKVVETRGNVSYAVWPRVRSRSRIVVWINALRNLLSSNSK